MNDLVEKFMQVMAGQPLSLALCAMNFLLLWFLFKQNNQFTKARTETAQMIVSWQKDTQEIMANCVSKEVMELVLKSLERDRETYRAMLPGFKASEPSARPTAPEEK
jgi:flagellar basal body-associated protein FliL